MKQIREEDLELIIKALNYAKASSEDAKKYFRAIEGYIGVSEETQNLVDTYNQRFAKASLALSMALAVKHGYFDD